MSLANSQGGFLTLLKKRNFLLLWLAQLISMTIQNSSNYAVLVLISVKTGSTLLIGLAIVCFSVPAVLIGAPAGVLVDHRRLTQTLCPGRPHVVQPFKSCLSHQAGLRRSTGSIHL